MRKIKTLLLFPPQADEMIWHDTYFPPSNIGSLGTFLKVNKKAVELYYDKDYSLQKVIEKIKEYRPHLIGLSCDGRNRMNCFKIASAVKRFDPEIVVVLGGLFATLFHREILDRIPCVDFVVRGEGELSLLELINAIENGKSLNKINGLTYRLRGNIKINEKRALISELDDLPCIDVGLFDPGMLARSLAHYQFIIQTSRGCPYRCSFCDSGAVWGNCFRKMSADGAKKKITKLTTGLKLKSFFLTDATASCGGNNIIDLCNFLIQKKLRLRWGCYARVDTVSRAMLELMRMAGCDCILYGVESFSDSMLRKMRKGYSSDAAIKALNMTCEVGIRSSFSLILGFPGESYNTLRQTIGGFKKLRKGVVCYGANIFEARPGSFIYSELRKKRLIDDGIWFTDFKMVDCVKLLYGRPLLKNIYRTQKIISELPGRYWVKK